MQGNDAIVEREFLCTWTPCSSYFGAGDLRLLCFTMTLNNFEGLSWSTLYYAIKIDEKLSSEGKY